MKTRTLLALLLAAAFSFGCGSPGSNPPATNSPNTPGITSPDTGASLTQAAQKGSVTFTVQFPPAALKKALMDNRTAKIRLSWYQNGYESQGIDLTPDGNGLATQTVEIPSGYCEFRAMAISIAVDDSEQIFDETATAGEIVAGNNTVYLTFLTGDWQFVDASDQPLPINLQSQSNGTVTFDGFSLKNSWYSQPTTAKIDYNKPAASYDYSLQWYSRDVSNLLAPIGASQFAEMAAQYHSGNINNSAFYSDDFNLDDASAGIGVGSRFFFIDSSGPGGDSSLTGELGEDLLPSILPNINSELTDGTHIAGTIVEMTLLSDMAETSVEPLSVTCGEYYSSASAAKAGKAATLKTAVADHVASATAVKKAAPGDSLFSYPGTITHSFVECLESATPAPSPYYGYLGELHYYTEDLGNLVIREFRAKGRQLGSLYVGGSVSPANITTNQWVQYRSYENSANDKYMAWIDYKNDGMLMNSSEFTGISVLGPTGSSYTQSTGFMTANFVQATWSPTVSAFTSETYTGYSGFPFNLGTSDIPTGDYTFTTMLPSGSITSTAYYPSKVVIPFIASASMSYAWNPDGSLTLFWSEPVDPFTGNYRVIFLNPNTNSEIFFGIVPLGTSQITLTPAQLDQIRNNAGLSAADNLTWVMQTRSFNAQQQNIARGYSNSVSLLPAGSGSSAPVVGTWMAVNPSNEVSVLAFIDSSKYLMGEDGVFDGSGGPGIEVGTYNFDPTTAQTTFSVSYETNGDWGPATAGFPATYPISELTDSTLTVVDPVDSSSISFNRVMADPTNPIVGSWYFTGTGMGETILVLLNNGQYYAVQVDAADAGNRFFESGTYMWNSIDGTFTGTGIFSSNPANSAIAAPGENSNSTATVSGNTLTFSDVDGSFDATRL